MNENLKSKNVVFSSQSANVSLLHKGIDCLFKNVFFFFFNQETGFHWRKEPDNFSSSKNHNSSSERLIKRWYPNQAKILFQM